MLIPEITAVWGSHNPRHQLSGRFYNPYRSAVTKVRQTLLRSALPSAVRLDGRICDPVLFTCFKIHPVTTQKYPAFLSICNSCLKSPEFRALFPRPMVSLPCLKKRHTARQVGLYAGNKKTAGFPAVSISDILFTCSALARCFLLRTPALYGGTH